MAEKCGGLNEKSAGVHALHIYVIRSYHINVQLGVREGFGGEGAIGGWGGAGCGVFGGELPKQSDSGRWQRVVETVRSA